MYVFIDESGDQGFSANSSEYMVFAMVVFKSAADAKAVDDAIAALKKTGIKRKEFKFRGSTYNIKDAFFDAMRPLTFDVRAVAIKKNALILPRDLNLTRSEYLYYFGLMGLINSYSFNGAKIRLDKKADAKLLTFMRGQMIITNQRSPGAIKEYVMKDSQSDNLIQLADMVAGAIARSYYPNKRNHNRWRRKLRLKKSQILKME